MMTGKTILEEIHPLQIIREVQKWPALYARDCPERYSAHHRAQLWAEVGRGLFRHWDQYSRLERQAKVADLVKKWRNLRDTFKRQMAVEKKIKEGHEIKKKRYVYYKHMSFLLPHLNSDCEQEERPMLPLAALPSPAAASSAAVSRRLPIHRRDRPLRSNFNTIDEDRHFLLSLVPSFRRMSDDQKLAAKVEILQVIRSVRAAATSGPQEDALGDTSVSHTDVKTELFELEELDLELNPVESDRDDADTD